VLIIKTMLLPPPLQFIGDALFVLSCAVEDLWFFYS
jgi:hypothetical protein